MEESGVRIDKGRLESLEVKLTEAIAQAQEDAEYLIGRPINLSSPLQVAALFYDELGLPIHKKFGRSTDTKALERLRDKHPVVGVIAEYRKLSKLKSTYVEKIPRVLIDGSLYSQFNNTIVETGRLSSSNPVNLQNIPKRIPDNTSEIIRYAVKEIRKSFLPTDGNVWVKFDQAAVEFRILLCMADERDALDAILAGKDIHSQTVADWLDIPYEDVLLLSDFSSKRTIAKTVNYATAYGQTEMGFEEWMVGQGIPLEEGEARRIRDAILSTKPKVLTWMGEQRDRVMRLGYSETYHGRRIYYPDYKDPRKWVREKVQREGVNSVIQGTAADIFKIAGSRIWKRMRAAKMKSHIVMAIHDEFCFDADPAEVNDLIDIINQEAPNVVHWQIPLDIEISVGHSWGDTHTI